MCSLCRMQSCIIHMEEEILERQFVLLKVAKSVENSMNGSIISVQYVCIHAPIFKDILRLHFSPCLSFLVPRVQTSRGRPELTLFRTLNEPSLIAPIQGCIVIKYGAKSTPNTA